MKGKHLALVAAGVLLLAIGAFALSSGPDTLKKTIFAQAMPVGYFEHFAALPAAFEDVSGSVYAFRLGFNRGLVIDTPEGLAIIDTFNSKYAAALKATLAQRFPGKRVKWVVYSHNHLDHIRGSDVFDADEVIGHKDVNQFVADWPHARDILPVTRPVDGDVTLTLGGVEINCLYMPHSHSQTLYGFHIPSADVVFAPDMMFARAMPPFDFPDFYYPGYIRALDRLIALTAGHYVPSHMQRGSPQDLVDYRNMTVAFQETVASKLARNDYEATDGEAMRAALKDSYDELRVAYGDWYGFDAMFVPKFGRHYGGTYLGY